MSVRSFFVILENVWDGHMSIEGEKRRKKMSMIFCAGPTFIIDWGVVRQSFDHVVSLF